MIFRKRNPKLPASAQDSWANTIVPGNWPCNFRRCNFCIVYLSVSYLSADHWLHWSLEPLFNAGVSLPSSKMALSYISLSALSLRRSRSMLPIFIRSLISDQSCSLGLHHSAIASEISPDYLCFVLRKYHSFVSIQSHIQSLLWEIKRPRRSFVYFAAILGKYTGTMCAPAVSSPAYINDSAPFQPRNLGYLTHSGVPSVVPSTRIRFSRVGEHEFRSPSLARVYNSKAFMISCS